MCLDSPLRHHFFYYFVIQRKTIGLVVACRNHGGDRDSDPSHPEGNFVPFINDDL
jgi:hypothetical protein